MTPKLVAFLLLITCAFLGQASGNVIGREQKFKENRLLSTQTKTDFQKKAIKSMDTDLLAGRQEENSILEIEKPDPLDLPKDSKYLKDSKETVSKNLHSNFTDSASSEFTAKRWEPVINIVEDVDTSENTAGKENNEQPQEDLDINTDTSVERGTMDGISMTLEEYRLASNRSMPPGIKVNPDDPMGQSIMAMDPAELSILQQNPMDQQLSGMSMGYDDGMVNIMQADSVKYQDPSQEDVMITNHPRSGGTNMQANGQDPMQQNVMTMSNYENNRNRMQERTMNNDGVSMQNTMTMNNQGPEVISIQGNTMNNDDDSMQENVMTMSNYGDNGRNMQGSAMNNDDDPMQQNVMTLSNYENNRNRMQERTMNNDGVSMQNTMTMNNQGPEVISIQGNKQ